MPRVCTVCASEARHSIDKALVAGMPYRRIAETFSVSDQALYRHHDEHLPVKLMKAHDAQEVAQADALLGQVRGLMARSVKILNTAEAAGDLRTALGAIRETRANLELLAELEGRLSRQPQMNLLISAEWVELRVLILGALSGHPEARDAVIGALADVRAS